MVADRLSYFGQVQLNDKVDLMEIKTQNLKKQLSEHEERIKLLQIQL